MLKDFLWAKCEVMLATGNALKTYDDSTRGATYGGVRTYQVRRNLVPVLR